MSFAIASLVLSLCVSGADPVPNLDDSAAKESVAIQAAVDNLKADLAPGEQIIVGESCSQCCNSCCEGVWPLDRKPFESDHAFDDFVEPVSNPIYAKDPRSLTEAKLLFFQNHIPSSNAVLLGGDFQAYAVQIKIALTERLNFFADKDGFAVLRPGNAALRSDGWLNMAAGLKYTFYRDVECQRIASAGFQYEMPTGESDVFQHQGAGLFTFFGNYGATIADYYHVISNLGYQLPADGTQNSTFLYSTIHLDRQCFGWIYPLIELNYYHWFGGAFRGLPGTLGEGDGLINFGTSNVAGNNLTTLAIGSTFKPSRHIQLGLAWEFPISNRKDIIDNRLNAHLTFRY